MQSQRTHGIAESSWNRITTNCGIEGFTCRGWKNEFETAIDYRFEAYTDRQLVTCKRCLKRMPQDA